MNTQKQRPWSRLDNAAKIFPANSSERDTKVFRFCCQLKAEVQPEILQQALDRTLIEFPNFRFVLRHGLFWYYFEQGDFRPVVSPEENPPCTTLYRDARSPLFAVTYHRCRINVAVSHALTDVLRSVVS